MAMYPFVGDRERDAALARITARHMRCDDSRWSEAGTDSDDPARDVLEYLRRRHTALPRGVAEADVLDSSSSSANCATTPPSPPLARNHGIHQALAAADLLRARYAALYSGRR